MRELNLLRAGTVAIRIADRIVTSASAAGTAACACWSAARATAPARGPSGSSGPGASCAPRQPALDCPDRAAQVLGRLLVGAALEVAEHDGDAVAVGKPVNFFVEQAPDLIADCFTRHVLRPHPRQDQERCLERVLRLVFVAEHRTSGAKHHRTIALDKRREGQLGCLGTPGRKPLQQLAVRSPRGRPRLEEHSQKSPTGPITLRCHDSAPPLTVFSHYSLKPPRAPIVPTFQQRMKQDLSHAMPHDNLALPDFAFFAILTGNSGATPRKGVRACRAVFTAWFVSFLTTAAVCASAPAADLSRVAKLKTFLVPRKASSPHIRASECVQKTPEMILWNAHKKITPSAIGFIYVVEENDGDRLLLSDLNEGVHGWASPNAMVPLNQAEAYFSKQIQANSRNAFAYLMRGVARFENDDLEKAAVDLDAAVRLEPKNVSALIARAQLWQWRNQLDRAVADASQAIDLDASNSYAYVERGIFEYDLKKHDKALQDLEKANELGSTAAVIHIAVWE